MPSRFPRHKCLRGNRDAFAVLDACKIYLLSNHGSNPGATNKNKIGTLPDLIFGVPSRIRTCNLLLRRQLLYPVEPWALNCFMEFGASRDQFLCNILCSKYVTFYIHLRTFQSICIQFYTELIFAHIRTNQAFMHSDPNLSIKITDD